VRVTQNGVAAENAAGVISYAVEADRFVLELESGSYVFDTTNTEESGVQQVKKNAGLSLYPNPAQNELIINGSELITNNDEIQIIDVSGKTVFNQRLSVLNYPLSINIRSLSAGVYILKVGGHCGKFVKA
jgi:hypothetical protein